MALITNANGDVRGKVPDRIPAFGFNTACDIGARLVRNLAEDARTTSRWYLVVAMGRTAGHLALGMGVGGGAARVVIPEEFGGAKVTLDRICQAIEEAMANARASGKGHGVAVVAEGVGELTKYALAERFRENPLVKTEYDEHGHVRLAEVPLGLIIKRELQTRAEKRGGKLAMVDVTIGYELRCADPVPFDVNYTHQLGWGAIEYLTGVRRPDWPEHGALICVQAGNLRPIAFPDIIDVRSDRTRVRLVDTGSDAYRSAVAMVTG